LPTATKGFLEKNSRLNPAAAVKAVTSPFIESRASELPEQRR
jgi:hypothetical protein